MSTGGSRTASKPVALSELVATFALLSDLGMGRPMDQALRQTLIALRLADLSGMGEQKRVATYYTSLLCWVGCAADTSDFAQLFGDETELYAAKYADDYVGPSMAMFVLRNLGRDGSTLRRLSMVGRFLATAGRSVQQAMESHCLAASELAERLELGTDVGRPLMQAFERWDGRGVPGKAAGTGLDPVIRLVQLADTIETFLTTDDADTALTVAQERRGTQFDPDLVDCFAEHHELVLKGIDDVQAWDAVIDLDPRLRTPLSDDQLEVALEAFADFADLKSPYRIGHSRGVATLAADAAARLKLPKRDQTLVRRAALVHDLGMVGVPSVIWDQQKPWSTAQLERARTHPYLTERMLARVPALAEIGRIASLHHERLDGSGYPHGLTADAIPLTARIVAAADVFHALRQDRPHRPRRADEEAAQAVREAARAGHLDGDAVDAVLAAAGQRVRRRAESPAGLTAREAEVLVHLARGLSNPQIADALTVSRKTVSSHLEHIYGKLGVTTRTQAALFAMRQGLVGADAPD